MIADYKSNSKYEEENKKTAIIASGKYVCELLNCNPKDLMYRPATKEENISGVDVYFWLKSDPNNIIKIDYKIRRPEIEKYWNHGQDVAIEELQNNKEGWCKEDKDIHIVWVFPWIIEEKKDYRSYYGCHMGLATKILSTCKKLNKQPRKAYNGYTWTSFYTIPISKMEKAKHIYSES
jgi:hypothetical protein